MTDILMQGLSQWGAAGIVAIAAGYVLWDSYKKNKENEKWIQERMAEAHTSRESNKDSLNEISDSLKELRDDHKRWREDVEAQINEIKAKIDKYYPDHHDTEKIRLEAISKISPALYHYMANGLETCNCDHIALALLHNGSVNLSGIPYVKFGIITEKYKPLHCPNDIDLLSKYKDEDIVAHNRLPIVIAQNQRVNFDITEDSPLVDIDPVLFARCIKLGIKKLAFQAIRDNKHMVTGFIIIYKFNNDEDLDLTGLHDTADAIEHLYLDMMETLHG